MVFIRRALVPVVILSLLEACGWARRVPSPPVASCYSLTHEQKEELLKLFRNSVPAGLGAQVLLAVDYCQGQCGFVLFTEDKDPQEVRKKVPDKIEGWPVCTTVGSPYRAFTGYDSAPGIRVGPPVNQ